MTSLIDFFIYIFFIYLFFRIAENDDIRPLEPYNNTLQSSVNKPTYINNILTSTSRTNTPPTTQQKTSKIPEVVISEKTNGGLMTSIFPSSEDPDSLLESLITGKLRQKGEFVTFGKAL